MISAWASEVDDDAVLARYPETRLDHLNKYFYAGLMNRELILGKCAACNTWQTPLRPLCASCWSTDVVPTGVSGRGTVFLLTLLHQGPAAAGVDYATGWPLAAIELEEQPRLTIAGDARGLPTGAAAGRSPGDRDVDRPRRIALVRLPSQRAG